MLDKNKNAIAKAGKSYIYLLGILLTLNVGLAFAGVGDSKGAAGAEPPINMSLEKDDFFRSLNIPPSPKSLCEASIYSVVSECLAKPANRNSNIVKLYNSFITNGKGVLSKDTIVAQMAYIDENLKLIKDVPKVVAHLNTSDINTLMSIKVELIMDANNKLVNHAIIVPSSQLPILSAELINKVYSDTGLPHPENYEIQAIINVENSIRKIRASSSANALSVMTARQLADKISSTGTPLNYNFVEYAGYLQQNLTKFMVEDFNYFDSLNQLLGADLNNVISLRAYFKFKFLYSINSIPRSQDNITALKLVIDTLHDDILRVCFIGNAAVSRQQAVNKQKTEEIIQDVKSAYLSMINAQSALKQSTKDKLTERIESLRFIIGYPSVDELEKNLTDFTLSGNNLAADIMQINLNRFVNRMSRIDKLAYDTELTEVRRLDISAAYSVLKNIRVITIPAALLNEPFLDEEIEDSYAGMGFVITHEMGHALDDPNLWVDNVKIYKDEYTKLQEQYSAATAREAWADNIGLYATYEAYQSFLGKNVALKDQKNYVQDFYINFARVMAQELHVDAECKNIDYPPINDRVNKVLRNQDGFNDVFDLKLGNKMYLAPQERVRVFKPTEK